MAPPRILDPKVMLKIANKLGKKIIAINVMVSRKAAKYGISPQAALILLAKEHGIGTATYQRKLDDTIRAEVRDALPTIFTPVKSANHLNNVKKANKQKTTISKRESLKLAIEYLIEDQELLDRCRDILLANSNFDRPISQATLVLEHRIRKKAQPTSRLVGENLVGYAFNEDLSKTVLRVASNDNEDQRGFTQFLRGIVPSFRNKTHHHIINNFSRAEAMRVCGFIDVLLRVVDNSVKVK